jgi:phosphate uptake regulator
MSMLRELLAIFRSENPLSVMGEQFANMLKLTLEMSFCAGKIFFENKNNPEDRTRIYEQDVQVNQLERSIRKKVVAHLSLRGNTPDVPYCLLLMSLVKDVERIGDYAKNLAELLDIRSEPVPEDEIVQELQEIRRGVEDAFQSTWEIFASSDAERAMQYIRQGRDLAHRCDTLILRIAVASYDASTTAVLVLCTRYYKRIGGHALNVLSSVVMPLHKIDYYDEDEITVKRTKTPPPH